MIIKNLSNTSNIRIWKIDIEGADIDYVYERNSVLGVGESLSVSVDSDVGENELTPFKVKITYTIENTMLTTATKEFGFIGMGDDEMDIFKHLSKTTVETPDEPTPETPVTPDDGEQEEKPTEPDSNNPSEGENNPDADGRESKVVIYMVLLCGVSLFLIIAFIPKKKRAK